jgi:hypothetical protein
MKRYLWTIFAVVSAAMLYATPAQAQATRTWVSGVGDDANPCARTSPCKTFAGAISKTAEGGEIDVLDPGGFGSLTITKAITVDGGTGSGWASVLASSANGFIVNVTGGTHVNDAVVIVRNVSFNGISQSPQPAGTNGINYIKAAHLIVENCVFENFSTAGINESSMASTGLLDVHDCSFDNTGTGILVSTSSGFAVAEINHCRFNALTNGVNTRANAFVTLRDCYFGLGGGSAVLAAAGCQINAANSMFANNSIGANVAGGTVRLSNNDFFNNTTGVSGTAESANNNRFRGNGTDGNTSNVIVVK